ncbi:uncharacterized protein LOC116110377 isoform X2 [Pistacia vera]|uniref:uncharacterized protein LOC116110377 isoform X1 n=1 Tax=Pistacia vera TaxID=55513 RepID=UPI001263DA5E|nr:uncharacterized protein LOC116110377 isoform X1 [Pistacia vera]XP_031252468.1 uncharacterized protein LOC116110377 isoform X2 [Pistacia vera]XP_031252469.1 uncharacterized protein LOC116110377 isoform X2 [Pistacia vera]
MVQLREVKIGSCDMLIEVVSNEEDVGVEDGIVFDKLKLLSLGYLHSLICFCYGNFTFKFPALEELIVGDCPNMKTFSKGDTSAPCLQKVKKHKGDTEGYWKSDLNTTIQQLYRKKVNSNFEKLTLSGKDIMSMWPNQFPEHRFSKVKVLNVIQNEPTNMPIEILWRFNNLEKLVLKGNSYQELFSCGEGEKHIGMLTHIKQLKLEGLFNLKHVWKQDSHQVSILRNPEELLVYQCHNLINLVPSSTSFDNLITLNVWKCDGLVNLVTSSTAKSMVNLEKMYIRGCETMVEIVANTGDVEKDEIVFSKLKSLRLWDLESLRSFCFGNQTFKFPALEDMMVRNCPKMNTFSRGVLSTPKLDKVKEKNDDDEGHWEGDLNTTIQHLFKEAVGQELPGSSSKSA